MPSPGPGLVLLLSVEITPRGDVLLAYSIAPGVTAVLVTWPGHIPAAASDPIVLAEVARIQEAYLAHR